MDLNKKILITGGAGYIGSHVVSSLLDSGYEVIVIDRLNFNSSSLSHHKNNSKFRLIKKDMRDYKGIEHYFKGINTVIHLAALVGEAACNISELETKEINFEATDKIAEIACKNKVKNFIFMSTASSYGVQNVNEIANEQTKLNPVSLYAKSKIECEILLKENYFNKINTTIFRPSTVYGDSYRMRFDLILNHLLKDAYFKKEIKVLGPKMVRPLMWVGEPARIFKKIIDSEDNIFKSEIFNLGYENENYEKIEIAQIIQKKFFENIKIEVIDKDIDLRSYRLSFDKMKKYFKLSPYTNIIQESLKIINKFNNNFYGDVNHKKFYNA